MIAWSVLWLGCAAPQQAVDTAWSPHLGASEAWSVVVINEFLASNVSGLQDGSGAHPDWLELYNPTEDWIDLDGWMISDDRQERDKHILQGLGIAAGGWLLLYDRTLQPRWRGGGRAGVRPSGHRSRRRTTG